MTVMTQTINNNNYSFRLPDEKPTSLQCHSILDLSFFFILKIFRFFVVKYGKIPDNFC